jgi:hypothetical protein
LLPVSGSPAAFDLRAGSYFVGGESGEAAGDPGLGQDLTVRDLTGGREAHVTG